jgi:thiol-disulfide isomerase/thioredoxin
MPAAPSQPPVTRRRRGLSLSHRPTLWLTAAALAGVTVLVGAAIRGGDAAVVPAAEGPSAAASQQHTEEVTEEIRLSAQGGSQSGDQAPQFSAVTTAGTSFTLPSGRPTVVFFMASWCLSCVAEAQALGRLQEEHGDRVTILGVDVDPRDTLPTVRQFAAEAGVDYGFVRDGDGTLTQALDVRALDTTVVTDRNGRIVFRDAVPTDEETLRAALGEAGLR